MSRNQTMWLDAASVMLRADGIVLPPQDAGLPVRLDFSGLVLLDRFAARPEGTVDEVVAAVASLTEQPVEHLAALAEALITQRLLVVADEAGPSSARGGLHGATAGPVTAPATVDADAIERDTQLVLMTPLSLLLVPDGSAVLDHAGHVRAVLNPSEVQAVSCFASRASFSDAMRAHRQSAAGAALKEPVFRDLLHRMIGLGLLQRFDPDDPSHVPVSERESKMVQVALHNQYHLRLAVDNAMAAHDAANADWELANGRRRVPIIPIMENADSPPLGLGMVMTYAMSYDDGALLDHYDFRPDWVAPQRGAAALTAEPGIFLVSNYLWSHAKNMEVVAEIKAASPGSITIHGGPDTPKYEDDVRQYFATNPCVDIAVHGEGEPGTAEILAALIPVLRTAVLADGPPDLSVLRSVPGISYRQGDEVVRTDKRDRLEALDVIPSPFLVGLFDAYGELARNGPIGVTLETNRGCPYGCTFCDWGSSTMSRIRKFDLDRVYAEMEWCAEHQVASVGFADANFGIFERDVDIANHLVDLKRRTGYPHMAGTNYAKNSTKHLQKIVGSWVDAGIITQGVLSLQTVDEGVLKAVRRSNIKLEKYNALAREFRKAELPLFIDLMMGLPGATMDSYRADLQGCIEREVTAKIHATTLLANSPMNDPEYRAEHKIEIAGTRGQIKHSLISDLTVVSTASYTREDFEEMKELRLLYMLCENLGALRQVARYVRHETRMREIDFYERIRTVAIPDRHAWPWLHALAVTVPHILAPPVSWSLVIDDLHRFLVQEIGIADDPALATVLSVQHALLPAPDRTFPLELELAHDHVAWFDAIIEAKASDDDDWCDVVAPLRTFGPGTIRVEDPNDVCTLGVGYTVENGWLDSWELTSPVARALLSRTYSENAAVGD